MTEGKKKFNLKFDSSKRQLKTHHKIINGDSRQMGELTDNQIGFHDSYGSYC